MLAEILNWATGGIVGSITGTLKAWFNAKSIERVTGIQADATVISKTIDAQVELQKIAAAEVQADKGWWVTAWMKPTAFYISVTHYAGVVFDSLPLLGHKIGSWGIPQLPGAYADMEKYIILGCVGIVGAKQIARIFK